MPTVCSAVLAPLTARVSLLTPTAASTARGIAAPVPKGAPFGSVTPQMPLHMAKGGRRGPPPHLDSKTGVGGIPSERASPQAVPDYGDSPLTKKHAALPTMSAPSSPVPSPRAPPPPMLSTEPSEESDLGPFSMENATEAGGVEDNESITAALRSKPLEEVRLFNGLARSLEVFQEPLSVLVARYHEAYFPQDPTQEDVLAEFGVVGGELPNRDPAQTAALRDTLIRYDKPHHLFEWEYLGSLIEEVVQLNAKYLPCFPFTDPAFSKQLFCLGLEPLSRIAYAVVAVQQIREALTIFLGKDP
ncbi:hypothetical protein DFH08DRAFT_956654 [Mycena albidolilacea]|uniref:Uncharacterized protein n=1 Tax=Mycena albidolilacea TaxID=1033008 RepID=A0AAD7AAW9_9AGAR|nr:hypothetical protein DFH08DRAFT_956654 [Mycena albidolilacea]